MDESFLPQSQSRKPPHQESPVREERDELGTEQSSSLIKSNPEWWGGKRLLISIFATIALYLSGFLVILTPLPLLYNLLRYPGRVIQSIALPCFIILLLIYLLAVNPLYSFYQSYPGWAWLLPIPGMNLLSFVSQASVTLFGLVYYLFFVAVALILSVVLSGKANPLHLIGKGTVVAFVFILILYTLYSFSAGISPFDLLRQYFQLTIQEFVTLQQKNTQSLEQITFLKENMGSFVKYSIFLSPSVLFCSILLVMVLNLLIGRRLFSPYVKGLDAVKFSSWKVPFSAVWVVIACVGLTLTHRYLFGISFLLPIAVNVLIVLSFVYFLQGLTIIVFYLDKKGIRPFFRIAIYFLILLLIQTLGIVIVSLGFFDSWFDFRKLTRISNRPLR